MIDSLKATQAERVGSRQLTLMRFDAYTRFECGEFEAMVIVAGVSWYDRNSTSQGDVRFQQVRGDGYQGRGLAMRRRRRGSPGQQKSPDPGNRIGPFAGNGEDSQRALSAPLTT